MYRVILLLLISIGALAQPPVEKDSLHQQITGALLYLQQTQKQETDGYNHWKGEWPSYLHNIELSIYFGNKGKYAYDSNCFSTATVHNILANVYLLHPEYTTIPPMLQLAQQCIRTYEVDGGFAFWHPIPASPNCIRGKDKSRLDGLMMRRPNHFLYEGPFCNRYSNVPNDADDTALGYLAYLLGNEVAKATSAELVVLPTHLDSLYGYWCDTRKVRRNVSYYNYTNGYACRTGSFLTWFAQEKRYTPFTLFFPSHFNVNLPQQSNEIDCVVNANILTTLSKYGLLEKTAGVKEACAFLCSAMQSPKRCFTCGGYYPTEFTAHYAVSNAIMNGVDSLRKCVPYMTSFILEKQQPDGSWKSELPDNDIQSTVYALLTLVNVGDFMDEAVANAQRKGMAYLLSKKVTEGETVHWPGGIYFSGGSAVRDVQVWKSDAVTTALCIEALVKYQVLESFRRIAAPMH